LHLTRRQDLLELDIPEPNLEIYDTDTEPEPNKGDDDNELQQNLND
jgi:hypothetical protein